MVVVGGGWWWCTLQWCVVVFIWLEMEEKESLKRLSLSIKVLSHLLYKPVLAAAAAGGLGWTSPDGYHCSC